MFRKLVKAAIAALLVVLFSFTLANADGIVSDNPPEAYRLWICGEQVDSVNASDIFGDGTAAFDSATNTLTLTGAELESDDTCIESALPSLTIQLNGDSVLKSDETYGIQANGTLTLSGSGSLTLTAASVGITAEDLILTGSTVTVICNADTNAILCDGSFTSEDAVLTLASGGTAVRTLMNGSVSITDSEITISNDGVDSKNVTEGGISSDGNLNISGSTVTVSAYRTHALYAFEKITITDSTVTAEVTGPISDNDDVTDTAAVCCYSGLTIDNSYVKTTSSSGPSYYIRNGFTLKTPCVVFSPELAEVTVNSSDSVYATVMPEGKDYDPETACASVIITASYEITFQTDDGEVLVVETYVYGQTPEYSGDTPVKAEDDDYTYEFSGWDKEFETVTGEQVYTAVFTAIEKEKDEENTDTDDGEDTDDSDSSEDTSDSEDSADSDSSDDTSDSDAATDADDAGADSSTDSGSASNVIPKTGDSLNIILLIVLAALAAGGFIVVKKLRK